MALTFGIEEEFVLLDPATLTTTDRPDAITRTARVAGWARSAGVVAAGTGTPYRAASTSHVTSGDRYARIAGDIGGLLPDHQINGLHVHVGFPGRDDRVRASNRLRPWLPVLLAVSANSPFWKGRDTGFASWRAIHSRRWTTYGVPPHFASAAHYDDVVGALIGIGATSDINTINWSVRLSARHPTVEVRIFDAQLDPWSTLGLATLTRILAQHAPLADPPASEVVMDAALWHAARHGTLTTLVHPRTLRLAPARRVIADLRLLALTHAASDLERVCINDLLTRAAAGSNGADQQRAAIADGEPALARLFAASLTRTPESGRPDVGNPLATAAP